MGVGKQLDKRAFLSLQCETVNDKAAQKSTAGNRIASVIKGDNSMVSICFVRVVEDNAPVNIERLILVHRAKMPICGVSN